MARISVDTERCVGAGQCVLSASAVFDQDDDGLVTVLAPPADAAAVESAREAAAVCPSGAITVLES
ncbi:ferredoxin [Streptomyces sp. NPDC053560]|uniref:ferredoxin n=1 Tax=Streptomyces sp. NPDC053560 TaxID=3365711 RepID=UPI0037D7C1F2